MVRIGLLLGVGLVLSACDGPRENAGEKIDNATGAVDGEDSIRSGPAETIGERQDQATDAADDAREANADALEERADATRDAAAAKAEALDQEADRARNGR